MTTEIINNIKELTVLEKKLTDRKGELLAIKKYGKDCKKAVRSAQAAYDAAQAAYDAVYDAVYDDVPKCFCMVDRAAKAL